MRARLAGAVVVWAAVAAGAPAFAQATRTWVSGLGDDANPCSRTAPCKTFAGAISKTAAGGEISTLDPGGFGAVTITKAITIEGTGTLAGILAAGTNGIVVSAGASDRIVLRGLRVNGAGTGLEGIRILSAGAVDIEDCTVERFPNAGIAVRDDAVVTIRNTAVRSGAAGVVVNPATAGLVPRVVLSGVRIDGATIGLHALGGAVVAARDLDVVGSGDAAVIAEAAATDVSLDRVLLAHNGTGVRATTGAVVRLSRAVVAANTIAGIAEADGGRVVPFLESVVDGNPPGLGGVAACGLSAQTAAVPCPAACPDVACPAPPPCPDVSCPACPEVGCPACPTIPSCPAPVCEATVLATRLGPCRKCKTRLGVTTCTGCAVDAR